MGDRSAHLYPPLVCSDQVCRNQPTANLLHTILSVWNIPEVQISGWKQVASSANSKRAFLNSDPCPIAHLSNPASPPQPRVFESAQTQDTFEKRKYLQQNALLFRTTLFAKCSQATKTPPQTNTTAAMMRTVFRLNGFFSMVIVFCFPLLRLSFSGAPRSLLLSKKLIPRFPRPVGPPVGKVRRFLWVRQNSVFSVKKNSLFVHCCIVFVLCCILVQVIIRWHFLRVADARSGRGPHGNGCNTGQI